MVEIIGLVFAIFSSLLTLAYKKPKLYSELQNKLLKYSYWLWFAFVAVMVALCSAESLGLIKILFEKNIVFYFFEQITGANVLLAIVFPPIILWVLLNLIGKVSKYRET